MKRLLLLTLLWLVLTGADESGLVVGSFAVAVGTWLSLRLLPPARQRVSLSAVVAMVPGFLWRSLVGGFDVAWRAVHPRMPIKPGWLVLPLGLPTSGARAAFGGELSLMPGTLAAGERDGALLVHSLDTDQDVAAGVSGEEARLAAVIAGPEAMR